MNDVLAMQRCLELAGQAAGRTAPNPLVGAVVVQHGEIVGEGWHRRAGLEHAEIQALRAAGSRARGATLVVNLEPCNHHGRTPPCTDAILQAGIARVVAGMQDPHPLVNGAGVERLRDAGVEVVVGVLEGACRALNRAFVSAVTRGRPVVTLKAACTLDGYIALPTGESQWITGEVARAHTQHLRNVNDALLVGRATAQKDDPRLTCRLEGGRDPRPVLLDSNLCVSRTSRMFAGSRRALVYTAVGPDDPGDHPAEVVTVPRRADGLDLEAVCRDLVQRGVHSLLVDGGAHVHRAFLAAGLADVLMLYLAPKALGGGLPWLGGPAVPTLAGAFGFGLVRTEVLGDDILLELAVGPRAASLGA